MLPFAAPPGLLTSAKNHRVGSTTRDRICARCAQSASRRADSCGWGAVKRFPTSSVGQLLGVGFALMFLLLGVLGIAVFIWHSQSAKAQRAFLERIAPLSESADQMERSMLRMAIAGRSYLLNPTQDRMNTYRHVRQEADEAWGRLEQASKEPDAAQLTRRIEENLGPYLDEADRLIARQTSMPIDAAEEARLTEMRERTIESIRRFSDLQRGKMASAIAIMQAARDRVSDGIVAAILVGGVLSAVIAWVTAQSVRTPVNELVAVATSLESGDWSPALRLVPDTESAGPSAPPGEIRRLARAIGYAAVALEQREQQLQVQNEELQAQNEEIQAQSEEINRQSQELQSQSEELQTQHGAIQAQNTQLKHQAEELSEADRRKNRFLGVLAHELRNPMAPISNSLALLKRAVPGSESALRAQAMIERQARHLIRLIDDLLDITRISQGKIRLQREEVNLVEIARACIEDQQAALGPDERNFGFMAPDEPVRLEGDATRLSQIVGNLLSNAVKFTERGGKITVQIDVDTGLKQASLSVSDDGIGLEDDLKPHLFQPFTQGATSLDRAHSGLGLGLSLVQALVELHDGRVVARSDGPGRGSEFVVTLPLAV